MKSTSPPQINPADMINVGFSFRKFSFYYQSPKVGKTAFIHYAVDFEITTIADLIYQNTGKRFKLNSSCKKCKQKFWLPF